MLNFGHLHLFESATNKSEKQMFDENFEMVKHAEDCGFDSFWGVEHHFTDYGVMPSAPIVLAAAAEKTKRIRLGTGVVVLPLNHPVRVAEEMAVVDVLSGGRVDFGVGRGYQPKEFRGFNIDQSKSREMFKECLDIIELAWTGKPFSYPGKFYNVPEMTVRPQPLQRPHPPIWMAALSQDTYRMVGERGHNLLFFMFSPAGVDLQGYAEGLKKKGKTFADTRIGGLSLVYVADTKEQAEKEFKDPALWYFRTFSGLVAPPKGEAAVKTYEIYTALRDFTASAQFENIRNLDGVIVGDPEFVKEKIARVTAKYGVTDLLCWTRLGGLDHAKCMHSAELLAKHVLPYFKKPGKELVRDAARLASTGSIL
ncbi:MAG: LLM class flavin-dependent oxidoreductase [Bdellovibrionota bacterium]